MKINRNKKIPTGIEFDTMEIATGKIVNITVGHIVELIKNDIIRLAPENRRQGEHDNRLPNKDCGEWIELLLKFYDDRNVGKYKKPEDAEAAFAGCQVIPGGCIECVWDEDLKDKPLLILGGWHRMRTLYDVITCPDKIGKTGSENADELLSGDNAKLRKKLEKMVVSFVLFHNDPATRLAVVMAANKSKGFDSAQTFHAKVANTKFATALDTAMTKGGKRILVFKKNQYQGTYHIAFILANLMGFSASEKDMANFVEGFLTNPETTDKCIELVRDFCETVQERDWMKMKTSVRTSGGKIEPTEYLDKPKVRAICLAALSLATNTKDIPCVAKLDGHKLNHVYFDQFSESYPPKKLTMAEKASCIYNISRSKANFLPNRHRIHIAETVLKNVKYIIENTKNVDADLTAIGYMSKNGRDGRSAGISDWLYRDEVKDVLEKNMGGVTLTTVVPAIARAKQDIFPV